MQWMFFYLCEWNWELLCNNYKSTSFSVAITYCTQVLDHLLNSFEILIFFNRLILTAWSFGGSAVFVVLTLEVTHDLWKKFSLRSCGGRQRKTSWIRLNIISSILTYFGLLKIVDQTNIMKIY